MTSSAKIKGNGWERELAKELSKIFGCHFNRNISGSGSYIGRSNNFRKNIISQSMITTNKGDVVPPEELSKMCVEAKFYADIPFHHFLINKPIPMIDKWIEQQLETIDENDFWFVAFKINRAGSFIVVPVKNCEFVDYTFGNHSIYFRDNEKYIVSELFPFLEKYKEQIIQKCS